MTSKLIRKEQCPECAKLGRDTSQDNLGVFDDGHSYCFSCEYYRSSKGGGISIADESAYTYEYLPWAGITADTFRFYGCLTKVNSEGKPLSIGFRYPSGNHQIRLLDKKEFYWVKTSPEKDGLFGIDKFSTGGHKYVTITEGAKDACSLYQVLRGPVVAVQSASSAVRDCVLDYDRLASFERVYLAFDNDAAGRDATRAVARLFDYNKVFVVRVDPRKDANEWLQVPGGAEELKRIWWNSKKYLPDTIRSSFDDFEKILDEEHRAGVPYPFPVLNGMTYGIRTGESVLITAQEGIGKTELMHAIEYQILKETKDAVGAIFLEEPKKRHLQAMAGLEVRKPVHLPDTGCTKAEVFTALKNAVGMDDRLHVYSHFGSDDPDVLLDTIRFLVSARGCRYILLDHITMAVSGSHGSEDERRALDYLSTRLEMMVKELDFALILVSHVNDDGLTRGSRYISKIADIRIDAVRDLKSSDEIIRNTTHLVVSKNRFSGKTGPADDLFFDLPTFTFTTKEMMPHAPEEPHNERVLH